MPRRHWSPLLGLADLFSRLGHHQHRADYHQEDHDRQQVNRSDFVGRLPQLRGEKQEHDEDQEQRQRPGNEQGDVRYVVAQVAEAPTGQLEYAEAHHGVDDPDANEDEARGEEVELPKGHDSHTGAWVAGHHRSHYSRHQSNDCDVERVETGTRPKRWVLPDPEESTDHSAGQGECQEH